MSDENGYPNVQLSTFITGDQFVFRATSGVELKDTLEGVAEHADAAITALNAIKQAGVANGVFTGDSSKGKATQNGSAPADRKPDAPPPGGDTPVCGCGVPMVDLKEKNFKNRWYAGPGCNNKGKNRECWGKK